MTIEAKQSISRELSKRQPQQVAVRESLPATGGRRELVFTDQERALFLGDLNPQEQIMAMRTINYLQLDPVRGQIYFWVFNKRDPQKRRMCQYTSIAGMRYLANRSGKYRGIASEEYLVRIKKDKDSDAQLIAADLYDPDRHDIIKIIVRLNYDGWDEPVVGRAIMSRYRKTGAGSEIWANHPEVMLTKCAEMIAHRIADAESFGDIYLKEELEAGMINPEGSVDVQFSEVPNDATQPETAAKGKAQVTSETKPAKTPAPQGDGTLFPEQPEGMTEQEKHEIWLKEYLQETINPLLKTTYQVDARGLKLAWPLVTNHFGIGMLPQLTKEQAVEMKQYLVTEEFGAAFDTVLQQENLRPMKRSE